MICVVLVHRDKKGQEIILTFIMMAMTVIAMGILYILSFVLTRIYYSKCQDYTCLGAKMIKIQIIVPKSFRHVWVCACLFVGVHAFRSLRYTEKLLSKCEQMFYL